MKENRITPLLQGCPATSERGFAGVSSAVLVEADGLKILFDCGSIGDRVGLVKELSRRGLAPSDIDVVVLSHLHFDHAGNAEIFPGARVIVHERERAQAAAAGFLDPGYSAQISQAVLSMPGLQLLTGETHRVSEGVSVMLTPGHTAGSVCMMVSTAQGRVGLAGDTLKNRADLERGYPLPAVFDPDEWRSSVQRLTSVCTILYPGHDTVLRLHQGEAHPMGPVRNPIRLPPYAATEVPVSIGIPANERPGSEQSSR